MATSIDLSGRDWKNIVVSTGEIILDGNSGSVSNDEDWFCIQVGGENNTYPLIGLEISGEATSPASLGSNAIDEILYLEVRFTPRGAAPNVSGITQSYQLIKWKPSETSTQKEIPTPKQIFLNTYGIVDGNIWVRLASDSGSVTFTDCNFVLSQYGIYDQYFSSVAYYNTTNNLRSTAITATANTVEELPSSTAGYIECKATRYGYRGDSKGDIRLGFHRTPEIGVLVPRYHWEFETSGNNTQTADAFEDGVLVVGGIAFDEGDTFRINRSAGGTITFLKNGVIEGTASTTDTVAMKGSLVMPYANSRLLGLRMDIGAGEISPSFENKVNVEEF